MSTIFKSLRISNWRQFQELDIDFHERLTVLTGANGAGKTTILNLLSRHFGWQGLVVSTPQRQRTGGLRFSAGYRNDDVVQEFLRWLDGGNSELEMSPEDSEPGYEPPQAVEQEIGMLVYGDGSESRLTVPAEVGASFQINIHNQAQQRGMHIPSHRPIFSYQWKTFPPLQGVETKHIALILISLGADTTEGTISGLRIIT